VKGTPTSLTVTPALSNICSGDSALLTSAGGLVPDLFAQDGRESQNANTAYPAPYSMYYGGQKMQMLILASELTAQGISAGTLTALQFPVVSLGANWGTSVTELQSFQMSIGNTNLNALAGTMVGGLTVVSTAANFTPVAGYGNMHTFNTPFVWNGTSNIIVETVFSNNLFGSTGEPVLHYHSATRCQSTQVYRADNQTFATIAAATGTNGTVGLVRPDFRLLWLGDAPMTWSPAAGLPSVSNVTVNASPAANTIYTVTANNVGCTSAT